MLRATSLNEPHISAHHLLQGMNTHTFLLHFNICCFILNLLKFQKEFMKPGGGASYIGTGVNSATIISLFHIEHESKDRKGTEP